MAREHSRMRAGFLPNSAVAVAFAIAAVALVSIVRTNIRREALREIEKLFQNLNPNDYHYKECAINARSPENEADPFERDFIERLNRDPALQVQSGERVIDGRSSFTVLQRGEIMEQS